MSNSEKGTRVYQLLKKHLTDNSFHIEEHDEELVLMVTVHGDDLPQPTIIRVLDDKDIIQILSPIPGRIPEDKRVDAAIAIAVANQGMINGCFDLDMNDGEIDFRVAQSYAGIELSEELMQYLLGVAFITTDRYNDKFFMLGKGLMSLEQFIEQES